MFNQNDNNTVPLKRFIYTILLNGNNIYVYILNKRRKEKSRKRKIEIDISSNTHRNILSNFGQTVLFYFVFLFSFPFAFFFLVLATVKFSHRKGCVISVWWEGATIALALMILRLVQAIVLGFTFKIVTMPYYRFACTGRYTHTHAK